MDFSNSWSFCAVILSIVLIYRYFTRNFNYWSQRGINGPKPVPIFGNLIEQFIKPKAYTELEWFRKYGKLYGIYTGNNPVLTVAEPELIKTILVKDFHMFSDRKLMREIHPILSKHLVSANGEDWKRIRSIVSPTFSTARMRSMYPNIKICSDQLMSALEVYHKNCVNIKQLYANYTMEMIATCAFGTRIDAHKDPNNPFIQNAYKVFNPKLWRVIPYLMLPEFILKLFGFESFVETTANEFFFDLIRHLIKERRNSNKRYNDFIELLLNAEHEKEVVLRDDSDISKYTNDGTEEVSPQKSSNVFDKYITEDEIVANAWVFFIAGYDTTASALSSASYELALNQDIQQRLYEEVSKAVDINGNIDYELLSRLPFLDAVLSESLRIHSPGLRIVRQAVQDCNLGNTGIHIFKDQTIEIPIFALHHSEEYFEEASIFNPDRFMPENKHKIVPYTYLPFGDGPRNCIGLRFALMGAKYGLAQVITRFKLTKVKQTDIPLVLKRESIFNSPERVIVGIEKRNSL